jgi:8-oxo-dGTP diphosphatase
MKYPNPVVRVILENKRKEILFLKRAGKVGKNQWSLPGGKVEYGQTLERACIDELKQETNLNICNLHFFFYGEDLPTIIDENHWIIFYFTASYSGEAKLNKESSDLEWISLSSLGDYEIAFGHDKIVHKYFKRQFYYES